MENQLSSTKDNVAMAGSKCLPLLQPSKPVRTAKKSPALKWKAFWFASGKQQLDSVSGNTASATCAKNEFRNLALI